MTAVTDFTARTPDGTSVPCDAYGNNVAILCADCGKPVLATLFSNQRGSSLQKPTSCRYCGSTFWVETAAEARELIVHLVSSGRSGRYELGKTPNHTALHNIASWGVIASMLNAYGGADYEDLAVAVRQHSHPDGGKAFVDYCIRNGWLVRA